MVVKDNMIFIKQEKRKLGQLDNGGTRLRRINSTECLLEKNIIKWQEISLKPIRMLVQNLLWEQCFEEKWNIKQSNIHFTRQESKETLRKSQMLFVVSC